MRALTICQPFATLIMQGVKRVENRTWTTKSRGRFYVHAGKSREWITPDVEANLRARHNLDVQTLPFGAVIGIVTLLDVVTIEEVRAGKLDATHPWLREHPHAEGPYCWVIGQSPCSIGPWPYKGAQGWFDIHPNTLDRIANRVLGVGESET